MTIMTMKMKIMKKMMIIMKWRNNDEENNERKMKIMKLKSEREKWWKCSMVMNA